MRCDDLGVPEESDKGQGASGKDYIVFASASEWINGRSPNLLGVFSAERLSLPI